MIRVSAHALDRIHDRTYMQMDYVKSRVLQKKTIDIGKEKGTNKHHFLFYSEVDKMCFVIIMDVVDELIVTVLPIDYHNTCSWQVSDEAQQQAKDMVSTRIKESTKESVNQNLPPVYKLTGVVSGYNKNGKVDKRINLSTIKRKAYGMIDTLPNNKMFCEVVRNRAKKKMSSQNLNHFDFDGVIITMGTGKQSKNNPIYYDAIDFKY